MVSRRALYLLVPYLLFVAFRICLSLPLEAPMVVDELGYLGNARLLATGGGLVEPAGRAAYKLGYSLFLVPVFLVETDPGTAYRLALVTNALLSSAVYPAIFLFLGQLRPQLTLPRRALAAAAVGLYPAAVLYPLSAMSASALMPAYCFYAVALFAAVERPRWWKWAAVGALAALVYAVHERAIGILLLTVAGALVQPAFRRWRSLAAWAALPAAAAVVAGVRLLSPRGASYPRTRSGEVLERAFADLGAPFVEVLGQGVYLALSSLGLPLLALALALVLRLRGEPLLAGGRVFWLLLLGGGLSAFAISTLFMASGGKENLTYLLYGRYNEGVVLPFLAVALALLHVPTEGPPRRRSLAAAAAAAIAVGVAGAGLAGAARGDIFQQAPYYFNVLAAFPLVALGLWSPGKLPWVLGLLLAGVASAFAVRWEVGVRLVLVGFAAVTFLVYQGFWKPFGGAKARQHELARVIHDLPERPGRILYDRRPFPNFHYYNYSYFLPGIALPRVDPGPEVLAERTADLLISSRTDLAEALPGARLVAMENVPSDYGNYVQYLWVLPGELQARLADRGWLFPPEFPGRTLCREPRSKLTVVTRAPPSETWTKDRLVLRIENRGSCPWPNADGLKRGRDSVRVGISWRPADDPAGAVAEDRVELPRTLLPGHSVEVDVPLAPPSRRRGHLPRQRWRVEIGLLHEGHAWFASWGDERLRLSAVN